MAKRSVLAGLARTTPLHYNLAALELPDTINNAPFEFLRPEGSMPESTLDYSGYNFWLGKLNQFNGNYLAAELVKAFITSSEYRQRFGP